MIDIEEQFHKIFSYNFFLDYSTIFYLRNDKFVGW